MERSMLAPDTNLDRKDLDRKNDLYGWIDSAAPELLREYHVAPTAVRTNPAATAPIKIALLLFFGACAARSVGRSVI